MKAATNRRDTLRKRGRPDERKEVREKKKRERERETDTQTD